MIQKILCIENGTKASRFVGQLWRNTFCKGLLQGTSGPYKERTVLIVNDSEESLITFAEITGTKPNKPPKYINRFKVEVVDWQAVGLDEPSWVKCYKGNVHRVSKDRMIHRIRTVDPQLMTAVLNKILNQ